MSIIKNAIMHVISSGVMNDLCILSLPGFDCLRCALHISTIASQQYLTPMKTRAPITIETTLSSNLLSTSSLIVTYSDKK